jgi:protein-L-isoaspartate(D-aspartate) O-methyltransferase
MPARSRSAASRRLREQLVAELEGRELIRSEPVREAFLAVPRELFVSEFASREGLVAVYRDAAILTKKNAYGAPLSSSSQPAIMAVMLEQLDLREGMRVLEIGGGTGYNAALLSVLVGTSGRVSTVDVDPVIAAGARRALREGGYEVRVVSADGRAGHAQQAPYDRIMVTASSETVPYAWFDQLVEGGLLELPLRLETAGTQFIPVLQKTHLGLRSVAAASGGFMPLRTGRDDDGMPSREPYLLVSDGTRDAYEPLLQLSGTALATLSGTAKRRLVATALGKPRTTRLGLQADSSALAFYLSLTLPKRRRITSVPSYRIGVIGRDGGSLALIEARPERREVGVMTSHGGHDAEEFLLERVRDWARKGRPTESDIFVTVTYDDFEPRVTVRWPEKHGREVGQRLC